VRDGYRVRGITDTEPMELAAREDMGGVLDQVFVYGTLLRGEQRHPLMSKVRDVAPAWVQGRVFDQGAYPATIFHRFQPLSEGTDSRACDFDYGRVTGELVRLSSPERTLKRLDAIEGFAGWSSDRCLYRRTLVEVHGPGLRSSLAWSYELADAARVGAPVTGGSWRVHTHEGPYRRALGRLPRELRGLCTTPRPPLDADEEGEVTWRGYGVLLSTRPRLLPTGDPTLCVVTRYARTLGWLFRAAERRIYTPAPAEVAIPRMAWAVRYATESRAGVISERETVDAALDALSAATLLEPEALHPSACAARGVCG